ncbi:MAG: hypothetical protein O3C21_02350 [Verrucomicrobia bacterium]|nr:hypothetical protein [Verrucomicrobiota bacterium]
MMRRLELHRLIRAAERTRRKSGRRAKRWAVASAVLIHALAILAFLIVASGKSTLSGNGPLSVNVSEEEAVYDEENEKEEREVQITHQSLPPVRSETLDYQALDIPALSPIYIPPPDIGSKLLAIDEDSKDLGTDFGEVFEDELFEAGEKVDVFSAPVGGNSVAFVFDVSTSMPRQIGATGVQALKHQLQLAIDALPEEKLFNVICFGDKADGLFAKPRPASKATKELANQFMCDYFTGKFKRSRTCDFGRTGTVDGITYIPIEPADVPYMSDTAGGSRYDLALVAAFQQKVSTIYLITDGTPSTTKKRWFGGSKNLEKDEIINVVYKAAKELYGEKLPLLHCIGINSEGEAYLTQLAAAFRSEYRRISANEAWAQSAVP